MRKLAQKKIQTTAAILEKIHQMAENHLSRHSLTKVVNAGLLLFVTANRELQDEAIDAVTGLERTGELLLTENLSRNLLKGEKPSELPRLRRKIP
jgi:hypothetical protein